MNIVLPLSSLPSRNQDAELKYAVRSLPPHENLYIIGRNPNLNNVIHIPFTDKPGLQFKHENIYRKCLKAFEYVDEFLFTNDDIYLLSGFDCNQYYYEGTLQDKLNQKGVSEDYKRAIRNTINYLSDKPMKYFDIHCPIIYEKEKFPVIDNFPSYGFCIKSLYSNLNQIEGTPCKDLKIMRHLNEMQIRKLIEGRLFVSSHENYFNRPFADVLSSLLPASLHEPVSRSVV